MRAGWAFGRIIIAGLTFGSLAAWAQDPAPAPTVLDDLEHNLEIARHERLLGRLKVDGVALAPFRSDGCSGGLSTGWTFISTTLPAVASIHGDRPPWERCCVIHDRAYHAGGSSAFDARAGFEARRAADEAMRLCVIKTGEERLDTLSAEYRLEREAVSRLYRFIADVMYRAVRLGGVPCTRLPWRWGFGSAHCD